MLQCVEKQVPEIQHPDSDMLLLYLYDFGQAAECEGNHCFDIVLYFDSALPVMLTYA